MTTPDTYIYGDEEIDYYEHLTPEEWQDILLEDLWHLEAYEQDGQGHLDQYR